MPGTGHRPSITEPRASTRCRQDDERGSFFWTVFQQQVVHALGDVLASPSRADEQFDEGEGEACQVGAVAGLDQGEAFSLALFFEALGEQRGVVSPHS
jgi:hypothetical protein